MNTVLLIDDEACPIRMLGYIYDRNLLIEMIGKTKTEIASMFANARKLVFVNADGVKTDCSEMKFNGFIDGAEGGNQWIVLK